MLRQVHAYWSSRLNGRDIPDFADFSAAEMMMFLPYFHVYDIIGDRIGYHVRLQGTRVSARTGVDLAGRILTRTDTQDSNRRVVSLLDQVSESRVVMKSRSIRAYVESWTWPAGTLTLWMPLTHGGPEVSVIIAVTDFTGVTGDGERKPCRAGQSAA